MNHDRGTYALLSSPKKVWRGNISCQHKIQKLRKKGVNIQTVACDEYGKLNLRQVFERLGKQEILSVLLEGGALVDKVLVFIAPMIIV